MLESTEVGTDRGQTPVRPWSVPMVRGLAILVIAFHLVLGYSHNFLVGVDDDRLWLYTNGAEWTHPAQLAELNGRVDRSMAAVGASPNQTLRFELREGYHRNYVGAALVHHAIAGLVSRWQG